MVGQHGQESTLDKTQTKIPSKQATDSQGVVFAYENKADAVEEGFGCDIIEISYSAAIFVTHSQEALLDASDTIVILCECISNFSLLAVTK